MSSHLPLSRHSLILINTGSCSDALSISPVVKAHGVASRATSWSVVFLAPVPDDGDSSRDSISCSLRSHLSILAQVFDWWKDTLKWLVVCPYSSKICRHGVVILPLPCRYAQWVSHYNYMVDKYLVSFGIFALTRESFERLIPLVRVEGRIREDLLHVLVLARPVSITLIASLQPPQTPYRLEFSKLS